VWCGTTYRGALFIGSGAKRTLSCWEPVFDIAVRALKADSAWYTEPCPVAMMGNDRQFDPLLQGKTLRYERKERKKGKECKRLGGREGKKKRLRTEARVK
jgi:hypothetical protein